MTEPVRAAPGIEIVACSCLHVHVKVLDEAGAVVATASVEFMTWSDLVTTVHEDMIQIAQARAGNAIPH